jgi:hypothetical protein
VDYLWRAQLADGDDPKAKAFLKDTKDTFTNDLGERQKLFTATGQQLYRPEMFADTANPQFYKQFAQSGISRTLTAGLAKELKDSGIDLKNGAIDLAKAVKDNPGAAVNAVWNAVKGLPEGVVNSFKETGTAIGEGAAVALNKDISDKLNAIYGTDVAGAQQAMLAIRITLAVTGAVGTAKLAADAGDATVVAIGKKLDEIKAEKVFKDAYSKAPAAKLEIDQLADSIAKDIGGQVAKAPIKSEARALEKIATDYAGDASQIKDLARNTIIVGDAEIARVAAKLESAGANVKNVTSASNELGYSGVNTTIKTKAGITAEIQVNTPAMIYAKEPENIARAILGDTKYAEIANKTGIPGGQGHTLYEQWRVLDSSTPEAKQIAAQSRAYYDQIRGASNGRK